MSFQTVRGIFEARAKQDLLAAGVANDAIFFDNIGETPKGSRGTYALVSLSFTNPIQDVIACEGKEDLRGSLQVNVYTPKNEGSKAGEDICLEVIKGWNAINASPRTMYVPGSPIYAAAVRAIEGPTTIAPDQRPHHVNVVAATWIARAA